MDIQPIWPDLKQAHACNLMYLCPSPPTTHLESRIGLGQCRLAIRDRRRGGRVRRLQCGVRDLQRGDLRVAVRNLVARDCGTIESQ